MGRQCEGDGGDRGMSLHIIDEVLRNTKGLFEEQGLTDDLSEKLKELWVSKLKAVDNESKKDHELLTPINKSKTSIPDSKRIVSAHRIIKRKKIEKGVSLDPNSGVNSSAKDVMCASSILGAPSSITSKQNVNRGGHIDGPNDTSDEDEDEDEDDDTEDGAAEEEPLGSGDDISDEDPSDLFNTENVVVCQYDKITRARNKWKFHLKDGIMNLNGKDY